MSFDIGNFVGNVIGGAAKMALDAVITTQFPLAKLIPGLENLITSMYGAALSEFIGQVGEELGLPKGVIRDIQEGIANQMGNHPPVDDECQQHVNNTCGGTVKNIVDELMKDLKDVFQDYKNKQQCEGGSGKGGAGKATGFRALMALLSKAEEKQFKTCQDKAQKVVDALGIDKKDKGAEQAQFTAMDESKTEAQILQMLCSAVAEVNKSVSGALQTSGRG